MEGLKDLYVLGAGSSAHSNAPLGKHFLRMAGEACDTDPRLIGLRDFLRDIFPSIATNLYPKFEEVLSIVDIAVSRGETLGKKYQEREILKVKGDLNYLIWKTLEFAKNVQSENLHEIFIEKCLSRGDSSVISLNYDTLMDFSLEGQGFDIDYGLPFATKYGSESEFPAVSGRISLIKLHGSLNWLYCPGCFALYRYTRTHLHRIFSAAPEYCTHDGTYLKGIIVPPTYLKNYMTPFLNHLWIMAGHFLSRVRKVFFIGCSFSDSDMWFKFLVTKSLLLNPVKPRIVVVNPECRGKIRRRYERLLGPVDYVRATFSDWLHGLPDVE